MTMQAVFNSTVIAESDDTLVVEGNHYFPPESLKVEHFTETSTTTMCPWKGTASYLSLDVDGVRENDAAWSYRTPSIEADNIKDYVAFGAGVQVHQA